MMESLVPFLRCPVTRAKLELAVISTTQKKYDGHFARIVNEGFLFADNGKWFYPVIAGIPRLTVEAFLEYQSFCVWHLPGYSTRRDQLMDEYPGLINYVLKKNHRTKKSFTQEWSVFDYNTDKTWDADADGMLHRFLDETKETIASLHQKIIFDAGCGHGLLNQLIAQRGAIVLGMDFSRSIERAFDQNNFSNAFFIQGDIQFPPVAFEYFDIVHSSGVLICTNNTELSFSCIDPCVKLGGKLSVWLYHPRKDFIHTMFNLIRRFTSKLPPRLQYYMYMFTLLPVSFIVKRIKGNKQNRREMMIDILDWFSPQFRWEHTTDEATTWYAKRNYLDIEVTTTGTFGFNILGIKAN
jgi:SAM-dependent methyltransferase/uncharacterized protein YbaR (Trm112 family)